MDVFLGGDQLDSAWSFEENGVDNGARLEVGPIVDLEKICTDLCEANRWLSKGHLLKNYRRGYDNGDLLQFNPDGSLHSWDLQELNIHNLPDSFCKLQLSGDLNLSGNAIGEQGWGLPENFSALEVGGTLELSNNGIKSLPPSIGFLNVGGDLMLQSNAIGDLPAGFASIRVGGIIDLRKQIPIQNANEAYRNFRGWLRGQLRDGAPFAGLREQVKL